MHSYLRAIGFSKLKNQLELDKLVDIILENPSKNKTVISENQTLFAEISMEFSEHMGIALRGEYDENEKFHLESYYPYYIGDTISTKEEVLFNKKVDSNSYTGMCDDIRVGVSLIFYLQNTMDYMEVRKQNAKLENCLDVSLSALSMEGKILLGLETREKERKKGMYESKQRNQLIAEARSGNQEAIDSLTIDDIDLFAMITKRAKHEDLYTIVESSFIPYGSESDNYSVIGTILDCKNFINEFTGESLYSMVIETNDLRFSVCINKKDLEGEPAVGRRFKGVVWMQGHVNFRE